MADPEFDVVITGMGCVSPHGRGVNALWQGLLESRSAFVPLTLFDASVFRNPLAGVVDGYPAAEGSTTAADAVSAEPRCMPRAIRMLEDAADEAMRDAYGIDSSASNEELEAKIAKDEGA